MSANPSDPIISHHWQITVCSPGKIEIAQHNPDEDSCSSEWQSIRLSIVQLPALARELERFARDHAVTEKCDVVRPKKENR